MDWSVGFCCFKQCAVAVSVISVCQNHLLKVCAVIPKIISIIIFGGDVFWLRIRVASHTRRRRKKIGNGKAIGSMTNTRDSIHCTNGNQNESNRVKNSKLILISTSNLCRARAHSPFFFFSSLIRLSIWRIFCECFARRLLTVDVVAVAVVVVVTFAFVMNHFFNFFD